MTSGAARGMVFACVGFRGLILAVLYPNIIEFGTNFEVVLFESAVRTVPALARMLIARPKTVHAFSALPSSVEFLLKLIFWSSVKTCTGIPLSMILVFDST